jgi:multiple sugar transport system permease protein
MAETTRSLRTTATPAGGQTRFRGPAFREALWGFVFIGPWLIGLAIFTAGPMIASLVMSLTDFNLLAADKVRFVGLDNYVQMTRDPLVATSIIATLKFAVLAVPLTMIASLAFALLLNSPRLAGKSLLRTLVYMPMMIPLVASTLVWMGFLNPQTGWLNEILRSLGVVGPDWTNSDIWIYPALSLIGLWGIGNFMLISLAGLQGVPSELYDAARIDGASALTTLRRVTIPLISPILLYNLVICLIGTFQYFTQIYTLSNGNGDPHNATLFINLELFREAFVFSRMGYGSAIAWLLFGIVLLLTLGLFWVARNRVYYAGGER